MAYDGTNWNHLYAVGSGGYIYGTGTITCSFAVMCKLGNISSEIDPGTVGPDCSSGQQITGCTISCSKDVS